LVIEEEPEFGWTVRTSDRYAKGLTPDEALWCAVQFLNGSTSHYLKTAAEHAAWKAQFGRRAT
jgi:hypothetical protein